MVSPRKTRAHWDDTKDLFLIQHLQKATRIGKKSDTGFKKDVWNDLEKAFNRKFKVKPPMSYTQIQTRMHTVTPLL